MNKTAIYSTIIASTIAVLAVFAFSSNEVDAIKPPSEMTAKLPTPTEIGMSLVAINDLGLVDGGTARFGGVKLFYGDVLCRIDDTSNLGVMIIFGADTLVKHQNCIAGNGSLITLDGAVDASFKKGDVLVLNLANTEVFRDTT